MKLSTRVAAAITLTAALAVTSCGSSSSDGAKAPDTSAATETTAKPEAPLAKFKILVSNDDGFEAEGISVLVEALTKLPNTEVTVYAPLEQQSGTGGNTTDGKVAVTDVKLKNGYPAKAVDGFPADTIRVAMDEDGVKPNLVITGINEGQNLAPVADLSGTIGAARAAIARGVPALATSQGSGDPFRYEDATGYITDWVKAHQGDIIAGKMEVGLTNLNVPSCATGKIRGLLTDIKPGYDEGDGAIKNQDCESTVPEADLITDVSAFNNGFAVMGTLPNEAGEGNR